MITFYSDLIINSCDRLFGWGLEPYFSKISDDNKNNQAYDQG
jgi:hypothetical protein